MLSTQSSAELFLPLMMSRYLERNETTSYDYSKPVVMPAGKSGTTSVNFKVRIPPYQEVIYKQYGKHPKEALFYSVRARFLIILA